MKKISIVVFATMISVNSFANPQKPIPICPNAPALAAYKVTSGLTQFCRNVGVELTFDKVKKYLTQTIKAEKSFSSCNSDCWLLSGTSDMASCVEKHLVDPYVTSFMEKTRGYGAKSVCATVNKW